MLQNPYAKKYSIPSPKVPLNVDINSGLQPGKKIIIKGTVQSKCEKFEINLFTPQNFIALHINPRFNQNKIVRNTDRGGWGAEETDGPFTLKQNQPFEFVIVAHHDVYKVAINGNHAFDYRHRIAVNEVTRLGIEGKIDLNSVSFVEEDVPRSQLSNPPIPSTVAVGGFQIGRLVQIQGQVASNASRFEINLQVGGSLQSKDITLHFNPRFDKEGVVVRNCLRNGVWGNEERQQLDFPFKRGSQFELLILCDISEWKVSVNGKHYCSYPHQLPVKSVDHIGILGDVTISAIRQFN